MILYMCVFMYIVFYFFKEKGMCGKNVTGPQVKAVFGGLCPIETPLTPTGRSICDRLRGAKERGLQPGDCIANQRPSGEEGTRGDPRVPGPRFQVQGSGIDWEKEASRAMRREAAGSDWLLSIW